MAAFLFAANEKLQDCQAGGAACLKQFLAGIYLAWIVMTKENPITLDLILLDSSLCASNVY